jgi:hypothetical protein
MLSNTLNTNEIKNAAGTELEFQRLQSLGRTAEFGLITESPYLPHRISIKHAETGSGLKLKRRSTIRVDKTVISSVDSLTPVTPLAYIVIEYPVGALTANTEMANVLAELGSFVFTLGTTTHLYDGTGTGAKELLAGGI